jgi:Lar family restriction alleviation protein
MDYQSEEFNLLKSCPFCGGTKFVSLHECTADNEFKGLWRIGCGSCRISSFKMSKEDAVKFWNKRSN